MQFSLQLSQISLLLSDLVGKRVGYARLCK
jgi:hypothetical protein